MMRLAIYAPETGDIRSVVEFSPSAIKDALLNIPEGFLAVEVSPEVTPATHHIDVENDDTPAERAPEPLSEAGDALRVRRDDLLFACDWTQLPDAPLTDAQKAEWRVYRQALRDVPETGIWPHSPDQTG